MKQEAAKVEYKSFRQLAEAAVVALHLANHSSLAGPVFTECQEGLCGVWHKLVMTTLSEMAAQTHGCHACGEERPPRIVAGRLTCPECGSENLVCID